MPDSKSVFTVRDDLRNSWIRFGREKTGRVGFLGGSITVMDGYRPRVCAMLKEWYPETTFDFVNAGISSTCSTTGAFRLSRDLFSRGPLDLLFVEFAVNDNQDAGHSPEECIRGMEGIVRHARTLNPAVDVILLYCVNESHRDHYLRDPGTDPIEIAAHKRVAEAYGLCDVNFAKEIAERIRANEFDWGKFGGCHPSLFGNDLYGATLRRLFEATRAVPPADPAALAPHPLPTDLLDPRSYVHGRFLDKATVKPGDGWTLGVPDWAALPGSMRGEFRDLPFLHSTTPGAEATVAFAGPALALYVLAGPDAGTVEVAIDGGTPRVLSLYHHFSGGLHYPRTVVAADDLTPGPHSAVLRVSAEHDPRSKGTAVRILDLGVNAE